MGACHDRAGHWRMGMARPVHRWKHDDVDHGEPFRSGERELWAPTELLDFGMTVRSANGNVSGWTLLVNGIAVLTDSVEPAPAHRIELDPDQVDTLRQALIGGASLPEQGINYRQIEFEVNASGNVTFGALSAPSTASVTLTSSGSDALLLAANAARLSTGDGTLDLDLLAAPWDG